MAQPLERFGYEKMGEPAVRRMKVDMEVDESRSLDMCLRRVRFTELRATPMSPGPEELNHWCSQFLRADCGFAHMDQCVHMDQCSLEQQ